MKLNRTELKVLAGKIEKTIAELAEQAQKELDAISDQQNLAKAKRIAKKLETTQGKLNKIFDDLPEEVKELYKFNAPAVTVKLQDILKKLRPEQTKVRVPTTHHFYPEKGEIFQALVLGQIECDNLTGLRESIVRQFVNNP